ncbi:uncharacterized protein G2W53_039653 [Senna tora]|uniref:RNase H type-1 domain-containing protein n=1 Tax=Senna tora TaxID=362788 RepID=A0A834SPV9_9FABA|nr:uncharacterized protein G2W53_039653 [Senna tora]
MDYFRDLNDPIILEDMSIKRGVEIALTQKITVLVVESDARTVIDMLDTPYAQASLLNFVCRD